MNTSSASTTLLPCRFATPTGMATPLVETSVTSLRQPCPQSPLARRYCHLGVMRSEPPPRDYLVTTSPSGPSSQESVREGACCISYHPDPPVGSDSNVEWHRLITYEAQGRPPPETIYDTGVDRCQHMIRFMGATDVTGHVLERPSFDLARSGYDHPDARSQRYLGMLSLLSTDVTSTTIGATSSLTRDSNAQRHRTSESVVQETSVLGVSQGVRMRTKQKRMKMELTMLRVPQHPNRVVVHATDA